MRAWGSSDYGTLAGAYRHWCAFLLSPRETFSTVKPFRCGCVTAPCSARWRRTRKTNASRGLPSAVRPSGLAPSSRYGTHISSPRSPAPQLLRWAEPRHGTYPANIQEHCPASLAFRAPRPLRLRGICSVRHLGYRLHALVRYASRCGASVLRVTPWPCSWQEPRADVWRLPA